MKNYFQLFDFSQKVNYKTEILAGVTVAMTMIPESLSFAIIAGFPPLVGLYGAFLMGIITAIFGGRPGLISGGAGATVIVLIALMQSHGLEYVFATVALAGIIQILIGLLQLAKFIRLVPQPVMYGFVNGLAVIIFMSQISQFQNLVNGETLWLTGKTLYTMLGLVGLTVAIVVLFPKITQKVPSSLVAIIVVFGLVLFLNIPTKTIADIAEIQGEFPPFHIPIVPFSLDTLAIIFPYAVIMAAVALTEGLLTLNLVDEITGTKGNGNKECIAQGSANIVNGFFYGMGGCPMIAQTLVNLSAGSRARLSGIVSAITILTIILVGAPVIEKLPIAALVGVMLVVAIKTFEWISFKIINKMPKQDIFIGISVALITIVLHNLALAVLIGVIISALVFAWESAKRIRARKFLDQNGAKHYEIYGPLFFASTTTFTEKFDVINDPNEIFINFKESKICDMSAINSVHKITERYAELNKKVHLSYLSDDCKKLLQNANGIIEVNILEDPKYKVAID